jgi:hypothetical protein
MRLNNSVDEGDDLYEGGGKNSKESKRKQEPGGFLSFFGLGKKDTGDSVANGSSSYKEMSDA